jgi:hypothetical protein
LIALHYHGYLKPKDFQSTGQEQYSQLFQIIRPRSQRQAQRIEHRGQFQTRFELCLTCICGGIGNEMAMEPI